MNQQQISLVNDGIALSPLNHQHPLLQHQNSTTKYTWTKDKKKLILERAQDYALDM